MLSRQRWPNLPAPAAHCNSCIAAGSLNLLHSSSKPDKTPRMRQAPLPTTHLTSPNLCTAPSPPQLPPLHSPPRNSPGLSLHPPKSSTQALNPRCGTASECPSAGNPKPPQDTSPRPSTHAQTPTEPVSHGHLISTPYTPNSSFTSRKPTGGALNSLTQDPDGTAESRPCSTPVSCLRWRTSCLSVSRRTRWARRSMGFGRGSSAS